MRWFVIFSILLSSSAFSWVELDEGGNIVVKDYIAICTGITENDNPLIQSNPLISDMNEAFAMYYEQNLHYDPSVTNHYVSLRKRSRNFIGKELVDVAKYCENKYHSNNYIKSQKDAAKAELESKIGY